MEINGVNALSTLGQAAQSQDTIAGDFDAFLRLLTTQLQNQNPLDPLDTNQFTEQLVQFSSVEQSIQANKNLEQLVALSLSTAFNNAVSYIGQTVGAAGSVTQLTDGEAVWNYDLAEDSPEATITVRNSAGQPVFSQTTQLDGGKQVYTWDGIQDDGSTAPDGEYSIDIVANDADGIRLAVSTEIEGQVSAVDLTGIEPLLTVNGTEIGLSAVRYIKA